MFKVAKTLYFNYGHRLLGGHDKSRSPSKNSKIRGTGAGNLFAEENGGQHKCSHLHGHSAKVRIVMQTPKLNRRGMVVDFYDIKRTIGDWIDRTLDHKMILNSMDPLAPILKKAGEPVILFKGNPTAEAIAEWIFREARRMKLPVVEVALWESGDSMAVYSANPKS